MIFKCLWLHFPFLSLFLYSQTLKADEVTVGSILLVTVLPVLFPSHRTVVAAGWVALQSLYKFQFPFEKLLLRVLPKEGKGAPPWSRAISPGGRAGGKQRCNRSGQFWFKPNFSPYMSRDSSYEHLHHPDPVWEDTDITLPIKSKKETKTTNAD